MNYPRIFITLIFVVGVLVCGGIAVYSFLVEDHFNAFFFLIIAIFGSGIVYHVWFEIPKIQEEGVLYDRKCQAVAYVVKQQEGHKNEFCQEFGDMIYQSLLKSGIIHEPFNNDPDNIRWEATCHASIVDKRLNEKQTNI